jgi:hypothetical protein
LETAVFNPFLCTGIKLFGRKNGKIAGAIRDHDGEFAYLYMKKHTLFVCAIYQEHFKRFA